MIFIPAKAFCGQLLLISFMLHENKIKYPQELGCSIKAVSRLTH